MRRDILPIGVAVVLAAGCAGNPIVDIDAPGFRVTTTKETGKEIDSLPKAQQFANLVRATYQEAIRDQSAQSQASFSGLLWLGAGLLGVAAGHPHRDAILVPTLVGGTLLGQSRVQLDARRVQVWNEGIRAIDCAKDATLPLEISAKRYAEIDARQEALGQQIDRTERAAQALRTLVSEAIAAKASVPVTSGAEALLVQSAVAIKDASAMRGSALTLLDALSGKELRQAVYRIAQAVNKAMESLLVNPEAALDAGLKGYKDFAASIAQGGDAIAGKLANAEYTPDAGRSAAQASNAGEIDAAARVLEQEMLALEARRVGVSGVLSTVDVSGVSKALKKCGVNDIVAPMALSPRELEFVLKGAVTGQRLYVTGGTPPYRFEAQEEGGVDLLLLVDTGNTDSRSVRLTPATTAGTYHFRVSDTSAIKQTQLLVVRVKDAAAPAPAEASRKQATVTAPSPKKPDAAAPAPAPAPAPALALAAAGTAGAASAVMVVPPAPPSSDADAMKAKGVRIDAAWRALDASLKAGGGLKGELAGTQFRVASTEFAEARFFVTLKCDTVPAQGLPVKEVRSALTAANKDAVKTLVVDKALSPDFRQIDLTRSAPCVKS